MFGVFGAMFAPPFTVLEHVNILTSFRIFESHLVLKNTNTKMSMEIEISR